MKTICECEKKGGGLGPVAGHFYDCPMGRQIHELTQGWHTLTHYGCVRREAL